MNFAKPFLMAACFFASTLIMTRPANCQDAKTDQTVPTNRTTDTDPGLAGSFGNSSFETANIDYLAVMAVNMSTEFRRSMERDDAAFKHVLALVDTFNRQTVGSEARLVVTQISGVGDTLLWEGTPRQLRQQFATAKDFRRFVLGNQAGKPESIKGLVKTTKYLLNHEAMDNPDCKPALFIISDAQDQREYAETFKDCAELAKNFTKISQLKGVCGWYFVDHTNLDWAKEIVERSGFRDFRVEADIVRRPSVPSFN